MRKHIKLLLCPVVMLAVYCVTICNATKGFYLPALLHPHQYTTLSNVRMCYVVVVLAAILYFALLYIVKAIRQRAFDPILGVLSFLIFPVGLVLGLIYRVRKEHNTVASNAYLLLAFLFYFLVSFIWLQLIIAGNAYL